MGGKPMNNPTNASDLIFDRNFTKSMASSIDQNESDSNIYVHCQISPDD
jgi:hypothetical protein